MSDRLFIRLLESSSDLSQPVELVRASFRTVTEQLGLDESNCPSHPSFFIDKRLRASMDEGLQCFVMLRDDRQIGFVGMKKLDARKFTLEKLAILPEERHKGYGRMLVNHICHLDGNTTQYQPYRAVVPTHHLPFCIA